MDIILVYAVYIALAFGLAMALVLGLGFALEAGTRIRNEPLPYIFFAIVAAIMAAPIATDRLLSSGLDSLEATRDTIAQSFWLTRALTIMVLVVCAERIVRYMFRRKREALNGWPLMWAFIAYAMTNEIVNSAFGAAPSFDHKSMYCFVVYFAVFLVAQKDPERLIRFARLAMLMFLAGSALAAGGKLSMVIERGYAGFLPGVTFRYYGLATHANTMGPLAIAFMICLGWRPFGKRWFNAVAWGLAALSLLLTQSKTSIVAGIGVATFLAIYAYRARMIRLRAGNTATLTMGLVVAACALLSLGALFVLLSQDPVELITRRWQLTTSQHITSLTGRTRIWAIAWEEFLRHPIFGYGPTVWHNDYRIAFGMLFAYHAHNQLLQSLSSAGIVGGVGLLIYLWILFVYAWRAAPASRGISLALVGLMLLRAISEVPFSVGGVMQSEFLVHLLLLIACIGYAPARVAGSATVAATEEQTSVKIQQAWIPARARGG